ncbi:MAG: hypothetical protein KKA05_04490 [Alphaproteobacteria bacterium]|nr:hypothetical protein [Alphaproteobacteria bacterium]
MSTKQEQDIEFFSSGKNGDPACRQFVPKVARILWINSGSSLPVPSMDYTNHVSIFIGGCRVLKPLTLM